MHPLMLLMFLGTFLTALSQVLLKQSADAPHKKGIYEYLNWRVLTSYGIAFLVLMMNTYAFTEVDLKYGAVIDTFSYVLVMLLSYFLLREKFTRGQLVGNLLILLGILIYMS